jgi:hypothetical protein
MKKRVKLLGLTALSCFMALSAVMFADYITMWSCHADAEGPTADDFGYDIGSNSCSAWVNDSSAMDWVSGILLAYEATCNEGSIPKM